MTKTKIAINGFGRIGRMFFRQAFGHNKLEVVAINDLGELDNLAYLLKHDSVYRDYDKNVEVGDGKLIIDGHEVRVLKERDPVNLPWKDLGVDIVIESTGVFDSRDKRRHIWMQEQSEL